MKNLIKKCLVCKNELTKKDGFRSCCAECLSKERRARLTANIRSILDNLYQGLLDNTLDQTPETIRTKNDAGKRNEPWRNKLYSGISTLPSRETPPKQ